MGARIAYSQPCALRCVAVHASAGRFWACLLPSLPTQKPKTRGTHTHTTRAAAATVAMATRQPSEAGRRGPARQNESGPQNRPLVILIPPAHTTPAILPLGDGSLCHPRGRAVGFLDGSYLGVGWDGAYLTCPFTCLHGTGSSSSSNDTALTAGKSCCCTPACLVS